MFSQFSADIWFCYGSVAYGFESGIQGWDKEQLIVGLIQEDEEQRDRTDNFFEQVFEKPKGLLRVEIRIFYSGRVTKRHPVVYPVYLYTDEIPRQAKEGKDSVILTFSALKGVSLIHSENWEKLKNQVWVARKKAFEKTRRKALEQQ